jgi:putative peptidoglycan lipid II flippase
MSLYRSVVGVALARGLGLAVSVAFTMFAALRFGSTRMTDIAFCALIIPNALLTLLLIQMPPVFVSVFKSVEVRSGKESAWGFARSAVGAMGIAGILAAGAGIALSPLLARALGTGFAAEETSRLVRWMQVAFVGLSMAPCFSVLKGVLHAQGSFFIPSLETAVMNSAAVVVIAWAGARWGPGTIVWGFVAGALARLLLVVPSYLRRSSPGQGPHLHPALREAWGLLVPVLVRGVLFAATAGIMRGLATRIPGEGAVSHLSYAERIFGAPQDFFIVSLGVVLLPSMARNAAQGETGELSRRMGTALRLALFLGMPAAIGVWVLAEPLVALLCERGRFDAAATAATARALRGYAPALLFSGQFILQQAFTAMKEARWIISTGGVMLGVTTLLGLVLVGPLEEFGLSLAWSVSAFAAFALSLGLFAAKSGCQVLEGLAGAALRSAVSGLVMGAALWGLERLFPLHVLIRVALGAALYAGCCSLLCPEEWKHVVRLLSKDKADRT